MTQWACSLSERVNKPLITSGCPGCLNRQSLPASSLISCLGLLPLGLIGTQVHVAEHSYQPATCSQQIPCQSLTAHLKCQSCSWAEGWPVGAIVIL